MLGAISISNFFSITGYLVLGFTQETIGMDSLTTYDTCAEKLEQLIVYTIESYNELITWEYEDHVETTYSILTIVDPTA